ncbi:hypothetical protein BB561_006418 [Smittium simulii]|uniref:Uncharacterized protein n=1 Tax=Smittium simulii TaxID=133385 RepID=A0A2T9Y4G1_9FUNG|nr:hypothetical protein BB561_006418 [Smittium simulii]
MSNVPGVIPSAAAEVPLTPAKRTRLEYSTVAKTGLIDPASKNDYHFNFPVSIMHLLTILSQKRLKKHVTVALKQKLGVAATQFSGNINAAIDYVAFKIDNEYISYQYDSRAKATYFMLYNKEGAENA